MVYFDEIIVKNGSINIRFGSYELYQHVQLGECNWLRAPFIASEQRAVKKNERLIEDMYGLPRYSCKGLILIYGDVVSVLKAMENEEDRMFLIDQRNSFTLIIRPGSRTNVCYVTNNGDTYQLHQINNPSSHHGQQG